RQAGTFGSPPGKRSSDPSKSEKESSECEPPRSCTGPADWSRACSSPAYVTSSPTPSRPDPKSLTTVVLRTNPLETARSRPSRAWASTSTASSAIAEYAHTGCESIGWRERVDRFRPGCPDRRGRLYGRGLAQQAERAVPDPRAGALPARCSDRVGHLPRSL